MQFKFSFGLSLVILISSFAALADTTDGRTVGALANIAGANSPGISTLVRLIDLADQTQVGHTVYYPTGALEGTGGGAWYYSTGALGSNGSAWYYSTGALASNGSAWYYPTGALASNGSAWYYPSGALASNGSAWYYPSGALASNGSAWYYSSGALASNGSAWYYSNGAYAGTDMPCDENAVPYRTDNEAVNILQALLSCNP